MYYVHRLAHKPEPKQHHGESKNLAESCRLYTTVQETDRKREGKGRG